MDVDHGRLDVIKMSALADTCLMTKSTRKSGGNRRLSADLLADVEHEGVPGAAATPKHLGALQRPDDVAISHAQVILHAGERAVASRRASGDAVEIGPADLAEREKRIGNRATRQRLFRELAQLDARLQRDLNDGSERRLRSAYHIRRGK